MKTVLSRAGYELIEAGDGDEAIACSYLSIPDLILLDIHMPGRDGFSVCATLRADPRFAQVPIIAMTAGLMHGEKERALEAGFSDFVGKPISIRALREMVAGFLQTGYRAAGDAS
jgi:two-component system cell cycle response regulator DivK